MIKFDFLSNFIEYLHTLVESHPGVEDVFSTFVFTLSHWHCLLSGVRSRSRRRRNSRSRSSSRCYIEAVNIVEVGAEVGVLQTCKGATVHPPHPVCGRRSLWVRISVVSKSSHKTTLKAIKALAQCKCYQFSIL